MLLQLAGNCKMRLVSYTPNCHYARIEKLFSSKYYADLFEPTLRVQTLAPDLQNGIVSIMMRMKMEALYGSSGVLGLGGSQLDTIPVLAAIRPLIGLRRDPITAAVTYRFADDLVLLPLQLLTPVDVITNPHLIAPSGETLSQRLQPGTDVVFLGNNVLNRLSLFGGVAEVLQVEDRAPPKSSIEDRPAERRHWSPHLAGAGGRAMVLGGGVAETARSLCPRHPQDRRLLPRVPRRGRSQVEHRRRTLPTSTA